jgi:hypothetical protein
MENKITDWLISVIGGLVSKPEAIEVTKTTDEQGVLFSVKVAKEDAGKVIGKQGVIANAIRTLLRSAGYMQEMRASMKVDVPGSKFVVKEE